MRFKLKGHECIYEAYNGIIFGVYLDLTADRYESLSNLPRLFRVLYLDAVQHENN